MRAMRTNERWIRPTQVMAVIALVSGIAGALAGCAADGALDGEFDGGGDGSSGTRRDGAVVRRDGGGDAARGDAAAVDPDLPTNPTADAGCGRVSSGTLPDAGLTATPETCGNGFDDDLDGMIDEGCPCLPATTQPCYPGNPAEVGRGRCRAGTQTCSNGGEFGTWGACTAPVLPRAEVCGDGVDQDCNGLVDDGANCGACLHSGSSITAWEMHLGAGPTCWDHTFASHGEAGEYRYASIPAEHASGWAAHANDTISFDDPSTLCGVCECRAGGDFTYFQTSVEVPECGSVERLVVTVNDVDDGVRITVFNSRYPDGITDPDSYAFLGGGSTANLARYIVPGHNRIVLTHLDDCCAIRRIRGATIVLDGATLTRCR